jgi:hypothetical protein
MRLRARPLLLWSLVLGASVLVGCGGDVSVAADAASDGAPWSDGAAMTQAPDGAGTDGGGDDGGCVAFDAGPSDPTLVAQGRTLIKSLKCQQCHGELLSGNVDGVASMGYGRIYPPNLTSDTASGIGCWTNDQVARAILTGVDNEGMPLCPAMPHFGDAGVDTASAKAIVAFLRTLPIVVNNVPDTACMGPATETDAGATDASAGDVGAADASVGDAGVSDASGSDAGASETSVSDASVSDAVASDASASDSSASEAGASEASVSDGGASEASASDGGASEASVSDGGASEASASDGGVGDAPMGDEAADAAIEGGDDAPSAD